MNYKTIVPWDATLIDLWFTDAENSLVKELVKSAVKITTGAPGTTAGKFMPACVIYNAVDKTVYIMTGTTASVAWTLITNLATLADGKIFVGNGAGAATPVTPSGDVTISNTGVMTIGAAKVLLAMLGAGITPSHVIKYAGTASGGTTATRAYTITGVASTDVATCVIRASTNAATIQKATLTTDTLTILFSTDPGASTTVDYQIARAAV